MSRLFTALLSISFLATAATAASAAPCRDAHGHFMKCAPMHHMMAKRCYDSHHRFMKCR